MDTVSLLIGAAFIGIMVAVAVATYKMTLWWLDEIATIFRDHVLGPVSRFGSTLYRKWDFIQWKKNKLPELQERTRNNDQLALTERIVKSKHVRYED